MRNGAPEMTAAYCRFCAEPLRHTFADLGLSPISNAFRRPQDIDKPEIFYPLHAYVCATCKLVQLRVIRKADELFTADYAYFSSFSDSWLRHAESYTAHVIERFDLRPEDEVVEIASNDGYLLQYFRARGLRVLGIDPAANAARVAQEERGIPTLVRFFGATLAAELRDQGHRPRLMIANNVLAHVPDINDFVTGLGELLAPNGVITFEFPHLLNLIEQGQFDTIYHEHYSYLSYIAVSKILSAHGLRTFDVEHLATHGGSLRLFVCHGSCPRVVQQSVYDLLSREDAAGLNDLATYAAFSGRVQKIKRHLLRFLIEAKEQGKVIVGYGAPAKGNTLLNYCGIGTDFVDYTVDRSPHKQGLLLPGTGIPVYAPERIRETRPDYVLILPWNLMDEIVRQLDFVRAYGGHFLVPIPELRVFQ
jgi:2-polyprenyl-3-methyl-5-hydroxy-6-metoxy-1,4-benzoquinol methylase